MIAPGLVVPGLVVLVRTYQWTIRPVIGANCRFEPSCSEYAVQALQTHGAGRGIWLAGRRVLRCNPWVAGGFDPVPPRPVPARPAPACDDPLCDDNTKKGVLRRRMGL